jgi:hypothetical protein
VDHKKSMNMDRTETGWDDKGLMDLFRYRDHWRALLNMTVSLVCTLANAQL